MIGQRVFLKKKMTKQKQFRRKKMTGHTLFMRKDDEFYGRNI